MAAEVGIAGLETPAGAAVAAALRAAGHAVGAAGPGAGVLIDAATAAGPVREDVLPDVLGFADRSGARVVLLSSALVYADAGEEWIEAADPVLAPAPGYEALPDLEGELFGSGARFLLVRLGSLASAAPAPGAEWVPLLDPGDLGAWIARAVELDLNGVYDAVTRCVRGAADVSRRVSGAALAERTGYPASDS